jgi:mediator of RNA polymerase II transcription subunit 18
MTEETNLSKVDPNTQESIPAHADTPWQVMVKTANPVRGTQEIPLGRHIEAVLEVQRLMKGLLDLHRQDA